MLNNIPKILSPDLVKLMMEMGHGDELVIGDGNYPAHSMGAPVARLDGHGVPEILDAILTLFPLDPYVERPTALMEVAPGDDYQPDIWPVYEAILKKHGYDQSFDMVERFAFYERGKHAFAVVATSEEHLYANIILKKGIVK